MSESNTGRPPAGEPGMVFYNEMYKYWDGKRFAPGRNSICNAWNDRGIDAATQEAPGWRWVSFDEAEERLGLGNEKAREMVHHSQLPAPAGFVPPGAEKPWVPPVPEGFGPWVEHDGDEQPISDGAVCCVLLHEERVKKSEAYGVSAADCAGQWCWNSGGCASIVAYAVKLEDQPTQEQVEATQQPWSLEQDAADWAADTDLQNRPMFDADDIGVLTGKWTRHEARQAWQEPTAAPAFMVRDVRSSDGLLTVREPDHRLGLGS